MYMFPNSLLSTFWLANKNDSGEYKGDRLKAMLSSMASSLLKRPLSLLDIKINLGKNH